MTPITLCLALLKLYALAIPPSAAIVAWAMWAAPCRNDWPD
jgi:hypothetical protein